jgi:hypothetical protein
MNTDEHKCIEMKSVSPGNPQGNFFASMNPKLANRRRSKLFGLYQYQCSSVFICGFFLLFAFDSPKMADERSAP